MERLEWILLGAALASQGWREIIYRELARDHFSQGAALYDAVDAGHAAVATYLKLPPDEPLLRAMIRTLRSTRDREVCKLAAFEIESAAKLMPGSKEFLEFVQRRLAALRAKVEGVA